MSSIDFSPFAPKDLTVVLDGQEYAVPGDIPIPTVAKLVSGAEALDEAQGDDAYQQITALYDELLALFRIRQPDLDSLPIGARMLRPVIWALLNPALITDEEDAEDPPRAEEAASTTKTTSGRKRSQAKKPRTRTASASSNSSGS